MSDLDPPTLDQLKLLLQHSKANTLNPYWPGVYEAWVRTKKWVAFLESDVSASALAKLAVDTLLETGAIEFNPKAYWAPGMDKVFTISTSHIKPETAAMLDQQSTHPSLAGLLVVFSKGEYGWWVHVPGKHLSMHELPSDLAKILSLCNIMGVAWLCLDRDADQTSLLPVYEW